MRSRTFQGLGLFLWAIAIIGVHAQPAIEKIDRAELERADFSKIGWNIIKANRKALVARTPNALIFADAEEKLESAAREVEFALTFMRERLVGTTTATNPVHLFVISNESAWNKAIARHRLREDGLALSVGRDIIINDTAAAPTRPDRIAHEMAHVRITELYDTRLPLWLEEGIAMYYGWMCAIKFQAANQMVITRTKPALADSDLMSLADLLSQTVYPSDPARVKIFYRQAEALVGVLDERFDDAAFAAFVDGMSRPLDGESPIDTFRRAAAVDEAAEVKMIAEMRRRCLVSSVTAP